MADTTEQTVETSQNSLMDFNWDESGADSFFGLNEFGLSLDEEQAIINDCLDNDNSLMLVATVDKKIISQLFVEVSPRPRLSHIGHLGLTVSKAYWRQAVGSKMLAEAINIVIYMQKIGTKRVVQDILEVQGCERDSYVLAPL